jgi:ribonucleoside-triphosphate reductase
LFSFRLPQSFVEEYRERPVQWGFEDSGGNSLGELVFLRTYSRKKDDGSKEHWFETCERVINGTFSLQKDYVKANRLPWSNAKAQKTAQDAYDRLFTFKWTPPGRGLWIMGTELTNVQKNSAALQNCSYVSTGAMTKDDPSKPFTFLMEASMLGVGVGFDQKGADKNLPLVDPEIDFDGPRNFYDIEDSREGWIESLRLLLESYLKPGQPPIDFGYDLIRPEGAPIKTFGGTAAGPGPLMRLHDQLRKNLGNRSGQLLTSTDIADIGNLIGVCVVSGNVRRSAELLIGSIDDDEFLGLKDYTGAGAARSEWSWMSNNSVSVNVGDDLSKIIPGIAANGEPGVIWMDVSRKYGRLSDPINNKDRRASGYNPCAEQTLESYECCTLVETFIDRHDSLEDYKKTLKVAYLYAKTVTLLPTHWPETNAIMQRNRRIGTSISGIANFADNYNIPTLRKWMDEGYTEVQRLDVTYSEWLCVRESIKTTTVKPSGTVSQLSGSSPGVHWTPGGEYFLRTIRFSKLDPMLLLFQNAGYRVETDVSNPETTAVVYFPVKSKAKRSEKNVTIFEKAALAALAQEYWSDNSVSVTLSFDPATEGKYVGTVLSMYEGKLKTVSFLPMMEEGAYPQMPYGQLTQEEFEQSQEELMLIDFTGIYEGLGWEAIGEEYCTTDACEFKDFKLEQEKENV